MSLEVTPNTAKSLGHNPDQQPLFDVPDLFLSKPQHNLDAKQQALAARVFEDLNISKVFELMSGSDEISRALRMVLSLAECGESQELQLAALSYGGHLSGGVIMDNSGRDVFEIVDSVHRVRNRKTEEMNAIRQRSKESSNTSDYNVAVILTAETLENLRALKPRLENKKDPNYDNALCEFADLEPIINAMPYYWGPDIYHARPNPLAVKVWTIYCNLKDEIVGKKQFGNGTFTLSQQ